MRSAETLNTGLIPEKLTFTLDGLNQRFQHLSVITINAFQQEGDIFFNSAPQPKFTKRQKFFEEFRSMAAQGFSIVVCCENTGQKKRFEELALESDAAVDTVLGNIDEGFILKSEKQAVFSENRLFDRYINRIRFRRYKGGTTIHHISALKPGDFVVHVDHGIGRFCGLERVALGSLEKDCIKIEYESKAALSVPVEDLKKVQKYAIGEEGIKPRMNRLGGKAWERTKKKAKEELNRVVQELVELYASRKYFKGTGYPEDTTWMKEFEESFIYEDTPDQKKAADEVKVDLQQSCPMDRLLCGDAGFGKTEVAMRAAFKVVETGKQVAVLVPTTILAYQHFISFSERFRDYPVSVQMVSRFVEKQAASRILSDVEKGKVDIIIGTHRLLSKDVEFHELGLLILDEEQRFGVRQKEKIKHFKTQIEVLAMTATPIPRTLQLSLLGARDLSLINTPPRNRMPVHTRIVEKDRRIIREAIIREKARGGQVYFVHNRVQSIEGARDSVAEAVPQATVSIAHGQMPERELEGVMRRFIDKEIDVLVCSAIIESGLDIPNVNTIIINDASRFGLSQLYQLRGRVGRSSIQAYAFLVIKSLSGLKDDAVRRLKTLEQLTEFGSGFQVAMRDLEIRGAGNLLGTRQHGLMSLIGFEMYNTLLKEALLEIKEKKKVTRTDPVVRIETKAFIPHDYIPDNSQRLEIYRRLSHVESLEAIDEIGEELRDRFGSLPAPAKTLLDIIAVRFIASTVMAAAVNIKSGYLSMEFGGDQSLAPEELGKIIKKLPEDIEIKYDTPFTICVPIPHEDGLTAGKKILRNLL
jgi:transcription-repair coupling factor (superfamily II helicase)